MYFEKNTIKKNIFNEKLSVMFRMRQFVDFSKNQSI